MNIPDSIVLGATVEMPSAEDPASSVPAEIKEFSVPVNWRESRRHMERVVVAGRGPMDTGIMFITSSVMAEECAEEEMGVHGMAIKRRPMYLKGAHGMALKDLCTSVGILVDREVYFTALVKWLLPSGGSLNPKASDYGPGMACLDREVREVQPKIVVTFAKAAFEFMVDVKMKFQDAIGAWFWSEKYQCRVMPMAHVYYVAGKPEWMERFCIDMAQVKQGIEEMRGVVLKKFPLDYRVVETSRQLHDLVEEIKDTRLWSIDCEWHGRHHVEGQLRSLQICWKPGSAAYIRFMDDKLQYAMDKDYRQLGSILAPVWNAPDMQMVGHHISADFPWTHTKLGLDWYNKARLDTEFSYQCCNEHAELGLERMSLRFSDLGRYEMELEAWKRAHKTDAGDGYGLVPDSILIPYACLRGDSRVVMRDGGTVKISKLVRDKYDGLVPGLVNGKVEMCRITGWHKRDVGQRDWRRLSTEFGLKGRHGSRGPVLTPDHKVLTQRGKVRVDELRLGVDRIATRHRAFTKDQMAVFLASLLGDGGIYRQNDAGSIMKLSQKAMRGRYLGWKVRSLFGAAAGCRLTRRANQVYFESESSPYLTHLSELFPRHEASHHAGRKLKFTASVASKMGLLGLAVWYQDDGNYTGDGECRITCRKFTLEEKQAALSWFDNLGVPAKYRDAQGHLCWDVDTSRKLLRLLQPYIHPDCHYKTALPLHASELPVPEAPPDLPLSSQVFHDRITGINAVKSKIKGNGIRYCLTVDKAGNFLTEQGFVSNCKDVDVPMRALPYIERNLEQQGMTDYYRNIMNPFVTNTFTQFALVGLPMNRDTLDEMRELYGYAYSEMDREFRAGMHEEAWRLLGRAKARTMDVVKAIQDPGGREAVAQMFGDGFAASLRETFENARADEQDPVPALRDMCPGVENLDLVLKHAVGASQFNIRSADQLKLWLYDVKGYTPIKSTANKARGVPATDWDKVMRWKPDRREGIQPAVDKQSLQILQSSHKDPMLDTLLSLNAVGNVKKAFLKEPERDDDGQIIEEAGLHAWLADDECVHGMFSMTETGRPRAWKPNSLNWPSYVQDRIKEGIKIVLDKAHKENRLPVQFRQYVEGKKIVPLRAAVQAKPGYVIVESDFKTAEVRGLGYIGDDANLIKIMEEPDPQFAFTLAGDQVRLSYARDCGIPADQQDPKFIMSVWSEGKFKYRVTAEDLLKHGNGCVVHPEADLHWSLIEMVRKRPRELMTKKGDRGAGKVGNFSTAYGATPATLERKIESDTGVKPPPGTGQDILSALDLRQPDAQRFLKSLEDSPENPGYLRAASGKVRHFVLPPKVEGLPNKLFRSIVSSQGREARNFFMQESVAATAQRAANWLMDFGMKYGLKGTTITVLYDSVVTHCPMEERFIWAKAHKICMHLGNGWMYHNRILRYPIDTEFNVGWSLRPADHPPTKAMAGLYDNKSYIGTTEAMKPLETWLDSWVEYLTENESASLTFSGLN